MPAEEESGLPHDHQRKQNKPELATCPGQNEPDFKQERKESGNKMWEIMEVNIQTELINLTALDLKCTFLSLLNFNFPLAFQLGYLTIIRYFQYIFL
jgi:hypothetical protein